MTRHQHKMVEETPEFQHDCTGEEGSPNSCIFLGRAVRVDDGQHYDLYYHQSQCCVVARYGNDGPEYLSATVTYGTSYERIEPLAEAYRRAAAQGLTPGSQS